MSIIKSYPSAADLDLDMWNVSPSVFQGTSRTTIRHIEVSGDVRVAIEGFGMADAQRDATARRIEMLGDLYDTLRELAERARMAGLDISQAMRVMQEMVAPKPFSTSPGDDA